MAELRDRDRVTYVVQDPYDTGAGAAAMVIISLILVAIVGYIVYAFNINPSRTVIERDTTTTVQSPVAVPQGGSASAPVQSAPAPAPAAPQGTPSMPAPSSDNVAMPNSDQ